MSSVFLAILNVVAGIFTSGLIQALVKAIEDIYKASSGAEKKAVALKMLSPLAPAAAIPILSSAVDVQVSEFNDAGVFEHKSAPVDPVPVPSGPGAVIDSSAP
jgi:hypothetical protein